MATYSNILAWESPWTEEPGSLKSTGSQRVRQDLATKQQKTGTAGTEVQKISFSPTYSETISWLMLTERQLQSFHRQKCWEKNIPDKDNSLNKVNGIWKDKIQFECQLCAIVNTIFIMVQFLPSIYIPRSQVSLWQCQDSRPGLYEVKICAFSVLPVTQT